MASNRPWLLMTILIGLQGCGDDVPKLANPAKPTVNGVEMTTQAFFDKYCLDKTSSETCTLVRRARQKEITGGAPVKW